MTPRQRRIASLAGVFVAGGVLAQCGHHAEPAPPAKVIVKPSPSPSPVYITKTIQKGLPGSCTRFLASLNELEHLSGVIAEGAGKHLDNMSRAVEEISSQNQQAINDLISQETAIKDRVDSATIDYSALHQALRDQLVQCRADSSS